MTQWKVLGSSRWPENRGSISLKGVCEVGVASFDATGFDVARVGRPPESPGMRTESY